MDGVERVDIELEIGQIRIARSLNQFQDLKVPPQMFLMAPGAQLEWGPALHRITALLCPYCG